MKGNQKKLHNSVKELVSKQIPLDTCQSSEKKRGRNEKRIVNIYQPDKSIPSGWTDLQTIISVERFATRKGKDTYEKSYYISSLLPTNAALFADGIRNHWSIENRLHYVKDVMQNEDNAQIKKGNGIETLSIFRNFAINIARGQGYDSIKNAQIYFASNVNELIEILRT